MSPALSFLELPGGAEASDWHLIPGEPVRVRRQGLTVALGDHVVQPADLQELAVAAPGTDAQLTVGSESPRHFRVHRFTAGGRACATLRRIPSVPPKLAAIAGLPAAFGELLDRPEGLILVGGATGAGKSTTLAAAIDAINAKGGHCIVTLEDPVEFVHRAARDSVIYQLGFGHDFQSWTDALKHGLRKDPDVVLIGELRDPETIQAAIHAANTGHLVLATVHGGDVASVVDRIVSAFSSAEREKTCALLAGAVIGILAQKLVATTEGTRTALFEFMAGTLAARTTIRENRLHQLAAVVHDHAQPGMQSFDRHIERLLARKRISRDVAKLHHSAPDAL